jgi:hypothetical protein
MVGYDGMKSYYRNTNIGNGKGAVLLDINGENASIDVNGKLTVFDPAPEGIILKAGYIQSNTSLRKMISWTDANSAQIAYMGYNVTVSQLFSIENKLGGVSIIAPSDSYVNCSPKIMENGVSLADKYVQKTDLTSELSKYAKTDDVSASIDGKKLAKIENGLAQFIQSSVTAQTLRSQIGAVSLAEAQAVTPQLTSYLSDMAKTDADKKKICGNIGAAYGDDIQTKLKDSGWIRITDQNNLYVRQIGHTVSIQGSLATIHSGTVFTLPNTIDSPSYAVTFCTVATSYTEAWRCVIDADKRNCVVAYCNGHGKTVQFSLTYMV